MPFHGYITTLHLYHLYLIHLYIKIIKVLTLPPYLKLKQNCFTLKIKNKWVAISDYFCLQGCMKYQKNVQEILTLSNKTNNYATMLLSNPLSKMPCGVWLFILCDNSLMYWSKDLNLSAFPLDILRWKDKDNRTLSLFKDFNNNSILIISNNKILTVECPF